MNIEEASKLLKINFPCSKKELRKKYLTSALDYHPDKNNNDFESTKLFQKVTAAYNFLNLILEKELNEDIEKEDNLNNENDSYENDSYENDSYENDSYENDSYENLLSLFIKNSLEKFKTLSHIEIENLLNSFKNNFKEFSLHIIEDFNQDTLLQLWDYIHTYKFLFNLNEETLNKIELIIKKKLEKNSIIILNPSLLNILNNDSFKLIHEDNELFVPLWKNLNIFKINPQKYLYIKCIPNLDINTKIIKENNIYNLHLNIYEKINNILENNIIINLPNYSFTILSSELKIIKYQKYILKNIGIKDYDSNLNLISTGDIIIHINIF